MVVVGATVAAGTAGAVGGAAFSGSLRWPQDSRVVLGSDSREDAKEWKAAIENQVAVLERRKKAVLPSDINPYSIISILEMNCSRCDWRKVRTVEGVRILERSSPAAGLRCRKLQVVVRNLPVETFLTLMETPALFPCGRPDLTCELKVLKIIDDHADIIRLTVKKSCTYGLWGSNKDDFHIEAILHRFWKYDDDGVYLITYSSTGQTQFSSTGLCVPKTSSSLSLNAVFTVSPRKDHKDFDDELPEALVTVTCQLSESGWAERQLEDFIDTILLQALDLRNYFVNQAYVRYKPGQVGDCKFTSSAAYVTERLQCKLPKNMVAKAPTFIRKEVTPLKEVVGVVRRTLSRTLSGEKDEVPVGSPTPAKAKAVQRSFFSRTKVEEPVKPEMHIEIRRGEEGVEFVEDAKKRTQFASQIKGRIASLEYGICTLTLISTLLVYMCAQKSNEKKREFSPRKVLFTQLLYTYKL
jgi:hypothetical protein